MQDIIVFTIVGIAIGLAIYRTYKIIIRQGCDTGGCGGCSSDCPSAGRARKTARKSKKIKKVNN